MPDEAKAKKIWDGDLLGRKADAEFLINFLTRRVREREQEGRPRSYVLNLDAKWGQGKTFFLTRLQRQLQADGCLVAYVNAWEDDHADDPLLAVMSAIDDVVRPLLPKTSKAAKALNIAVDSGKEIAVSSIKTTAAHWTKKMLGDVIENISDIVGSCAEKDGDVEGESAPQKNVKSAVSKEVDKLFSRQGDELMDRFSRGKKAITTFRRNLAGALKQIPASKKKELPLFVLVDELDRCRPTYAISLLECVKHLFEVDNVVFIIATDSSQLRHSIKAVYGADFDSSGYLLRFFDRRYEFESPSIEDFVDHLFVLHQIDEKKLSSPPDNNHREFFIKVAKTFNLGLRDVEQTFDVMRSVVTVWPHEFEIELLCLLPLVIGFIHQDESLMRLVDEKGKLVADKIEVNPYGGVVRFEGQRTWGGYLQAEEFTIVDAIQRLASYLKQPIAKTLDIEESRSVFEIWISGGLRREASGSRSKHSIMCVYINYVRSAGRLLVSKSVG